MDALMIPIVQAPKAIAAVQVQNITGNKTGTNFSAYMESKLNTENQGNSALFGMGQSKVVSSTATSGKSVPASSQEEPLAATNIAALLTQFVQDLKTASEEKKLGAGEWAFPPPAPQLMQKMAKDAGMNESQLAGLFAKVKNQDGNLPLADLLASFSRHFQGLQAEAPVTAPETDLPLVQLILERLGVPVAEVEKISQATVRGDNTFDLKKLAELVQGIPGERITDLTPLEAEQLQDLLAAAGVSGQLQRTLLPERLPVIEGLVESGPPVTITLGRLQDILGQAVQEVKANQLQADPIAFLTDLQEVLARSGFETAGPPLSAAVQGAVVAIFEELMESVDFSKIRVHQGQSVTAAGYTAKNADGEPVEEQVISQPDFEEKVLGAMPAAKGKNAEILPGAMPGSRVLPTDVRGAQGSFSTAEDYLAGGKLMSAANGKILAAESAAPVLDTLAGDKLLFAATGKVSAAESAVPVLDTLAGGKLLPTATGKVSAAESAVPVLNSLAGGKLLSAANGEVHAPKSALFDRSSLANENGFSTVNAEVQGIEMLTAAPAMENEQSPAFGRGSMAEAPGSQDAPVSGELFNENNVSFQGVVAAAKGEMANENKTVSPAARPFVHVSTLSPSLQQQSFAQLSHGVLQGLRNQEHHLVLKLYPKELGEVKVEMMVRDNQVAVSFAMENSRVKEVLESNLDQFRGNLEKQGFTIGDCMVSLNKDDSGSEAWQQFQAASLEKGVGQRKATLADLPDDIFYQRVQTGNSRENGVDLFA